MRHLIKNKDKRKRLAHIGAGVIILIHAYEKYESGHNSYKTFLLAGIVFLLIALFHPVIEKKIPWVEGAFFIIEGILSLIIALDYFHLGKKAVPISYILIGLFQFFLAFRKSKKAIKLHKSKS